MPLAGHGLRPTALRRRASRPQLKRDPLGGALPPHTHSFVNSFGTVSTRGAEAPYARELAPARRAPPTPRPQQSLPRRAPPSIGWLPRGNFSAQRRARPPSRARRARASVPSAPSNTRLELAAPVCRGRIPFVTNQARRRSSSASRYAASLSPQRWTLPERLFRGAALAVAGAALALVIILGIDMRRYNGPSYILPAVLLGATIGGVYGFIRNRV